MRGLLDRFGLQPINGTFIEGIFAYVAALA